MLKRNILFFKSQISQIHNGGLLVVYRKIIRLFWLLFMNIFAPFAVRFEINWPKAYIFIGRKNIKKLKKIRSQPNPSTAVIKKIENQTIQDFKKIVDQEPSLADQWDWINVSLELGTLYCIQGRMEEMHDVYKKNSELRSKIAASHQFDDLKIGFLPRNLAVGSIGVYEYLDAYVKAGLLGLHPLKKLILLVDHKESINNPSYLNCWHRYVTVITDPTLIQLLTPLEERLTIPMNYYMVLHGKIYKRFLTIGYVGEQWVRERRDPILKLSDEHHQRGWQCLKTYGLNEDDWFVCFHVRESGWKDKDSRGNDFRNADIDTYQSAMKAVTDAGGWVFRMGDSTMKPLPQMPRVVDYAHSEAKSDWMDVFLCAQCRFFVTTSSGLHLFAITFGKPIVMTNSLPPCGIYYLTSKDLYIPKYLIKSCEGRYMKFSELFVPLLAMADGKFSYDKEDIEIVNNSEDDIKDLVEEMLERSAGGGQYSERDENLQMRFKSVLSDCGKRYGGEYVAANARIGRQWLRKHEEAL